MSEEVAALIAELDVTLKAPEVRPRAYTLRDLYEVEPQRLMVESLFSPGQHGMFYGPPGAGKTFAIADMAVRGALALPIFGKLEVERPFKTLICAAEGALDRLAARFVVAAALYGLELDSNMIRLIPDVPALFAPTDSDNGLNRFLKDLEDLEIEDFRPDHIVFDTQSDLVIGGDDNSNADASVVLANLRIIRDASGAATSNIHHPTKDGAHYRGAAVWRQKCDFIVEITGADNPRRIRCDKLKDGEPFRPIAGNLRSVPDPRRPDDRKLNSAVFEWLDINPRKSSNEETRARNIEAIVEQLRLNHAGSGSKREPPSNAVMAKDIREAVGISETKVLEILKMLAEDATTGVRSGHLPATRKNALAFWWDETWHETNS